MRFECGRRARERHERKLSWHRWFAWYPVRVGIERCVWLEVVWRKGEYCAGGMANEWYEWEYSLEPPKEGVDHE